jgi:hypothetical protein
MPMRSSPTRCCDRTATQFAASTMAIGSPIPCESHSLGVVEDAVPVACAG